MFGNRIVQTKTAPPTSTNEKIAVEAWCKSSSTNWVEHTRVSWGSGGVSGLYKVLICLCGVSRDEAGPIRIPAHAALHLARVASHYFIHTCASLKSSLRKP